MSNIQSKAANRPAIVGWAGVELWTLVGIFSVSVFFAQYTLWAIAIGLVVWWRCAVITAEDPQLFRRKWLWFRRRILRPNLNCYRWNCSAYHPTETRFTYKSRR